jgi:hypothetical protein
MSTLSAKVWCCVPVGLLACMLAGLGTMATIAIRDPGFALERDYYKKAIAYDREIVQRNENARLGWAAVVETGAASSAGRTPLVVRLSDARGAVTGARARVEALRNAAAARVLDAELREAPAGVYTAELPLVHGGLWELRFSFERNGERMTAVVRRDVREATR